MRKTVMLMLLVATLTATAGNKKLSRTEAETLRTSLVEEWKQDVIRRLGADYESLAMRHDTLRMPIWKRLYGQAPWGRRSMFISMHGGGGTAHAVNDQQWSNQQRLYTPAEGLYVAPRAPWDEWNMWFKPGMDELLGRLIAAAVAIDGVDPDRVYLTGYSAGGDGVWRMAPRMADRWAAASMMAGHPGTVSLLNLRNLPYMIWVGALDSAYHRNTEDAARGEEMDRLQRADAQGYVHQTHVVEGKGHWMDRADTAAIAWMAQYSRDAYPRRIVWRQDDEVLRHDFYWLHISDLDLGGGREVVVSLEGNTIRIEKSDCRELTFLLNDEMMDLDRPVSVYYRDRLLRRKRVSRSEATLRRTLYDRDDPRYAFPAELTVRIPAVE